MRAPPSSIGLRLVWRAREDSNLRPSGPQPDALSTELRARRDAMAEREGFEPSEEEIPFNGLANRRTRPLCDLSASGADDSMGPSGPGLRQPVLPIAATLTSPPPIRARPVQRLLRHRLSVSRHSARGGAAAAFERGRAPIEIERWERGPPAERGIGSAPSIRIRGGHDRAPHKERVAAPSVMLSDEDAKASGAANVAVKRIEPARTQHRCRRACGPAWQSILPKVAGRWPRQAVVLGAGGGARAVVAVLHRLRISARGGLQPPPPQGRGSGRALRPVGAGSMDLRALPWHETFLEVGAGRRRKLLVNASGRRRRGGTSPLPPELLRTSLFVLDLVLNHAATPLMREAQARGGTVANGQASFLAARRPPSSCSPGRLRRPR